MEKRQEIGRILLNAKIELSKALLLIDELYEDGEAEQEEWGELYNIKNQLRDYIEKTRKEDK